MFKRILFATDFSPHAEVAKQVAICLAQANGNRLWALTVLEPVEEPLSMADEPPLAPHREWERLVATQEQQMEQDRLQRLDQDVAEIKAAGITVTDMVREGDPDKEIVAAAKEIGADVIVMGSHGRRNLWDVVMGSTAQKVAQEAPCPVIIVSHRPPHRGAATLKHFLFATDFSPHANVAEKIAISLAKERGEDERLWVLTVIEPGEEIPMPPGFVVNAPDQAVVDLDKELRSNVEAAVDKRLDAIVADAQAQGVKAEKLIRHGYADKEILKAAIDVEADMIILGSHSRQSLRDKLMGNTPAAVTKRASCPVLVVSHLPEHQRPQAASAAEALAEAS